MVGYRLSRCCRPRMGGRGERQTGSWESLVLPAPARLLPLLPTANSVMDVALLRVANFRNGQRPGTFVPSPGWSPMSPATRLQLLDFDRSASGFEFLLELLGVFLR